MQGFESLPLKSWRSSGAGGKSGVAADFEDAGLIDPVGCLNLDAYRFRFHRLEVVTVHALEVVLYGCEIPALPVRRSETGIRRRFPFESSRKSRSS